MSECQGIRCDRCSARALLLEKQHVTTMPEGWSVVQASRADPFYKATFDLCPACTGEVLSVMKRKTT